MSDELDFLHENSLSLNKSPIYRRLGQTCTDLRPYVDHFFLKCVGFLYHYLLAMTVPMHISKKKLVICNLIICERITRYVPVIINNARGYSCKTLLFTMLKVRDQSSKLRDVDGNYAPK